MSQICRPLTSAGALHHPVEAAVDILAEPLIQAAADGALAASVDGVEIFRDVVPETSDLRHVVFFHDEDPGKLARRGSENRFHQPAVAKTCKGNHAAQLAEAAGGELQIRIVAQPRSEAAFEPGLRGIDFPRVDVSDQRNPIFIGFASAQARHPERKNAQIAAAANREIAAAHPAKRGHWKLDQRTGGGIHAERNTRRIRHAVDIVLDGKDAGIVAEAQLRKNVQRPQGFLHHGKTGRAIAVDRGSRRHPRSGVWRGGCRREIPRAKA